MWTTSTGFPPLFPLFCACLDLCWLLPLLGAPISALGRRKYFNLPPDLYAVLPLNFAPSKQTPILVDLPIFLITCILCNPAGKFPDMTMICQGLHCN